MHVYYMHESTTKAHNKRWYLRKWVWVAGILTLLAVVYAALVQAYIAPNPIGLYNYYFGPGVERCDPDDAFYPFCIQNSSFECQVMGQCVDKPVIYLYPEATTDVIVRLDYDGTLIADYPTFDEELGGWSVTAQPDGTLTNHADGKEYSYLFWEGQSAESIDWDLSTGFVVAGSDTREFLQDTLAEIGLTPKEYNEFIVYWYPKMKDNAYNLIHFAAEQYTDTAPLTITPEPDNMLRVFMVYKPLPKAIAISPQTFAPFERSGFTVVEWGGTEVR